MPESPDGLEAQVKKLTAELKESDLRFRNIVEQNADGIIVVNGDGLVRFVNPAAEKLFAFQSNEVIGQSLDILLPDYVRAEHHKHIANFGQDNDSQSRSKDTRAEVTARRKDGQLIPSEGSICKFKFKGSMVYTVFLRDITERKKAEEEIRKLAQTDPLTGLSNRHYFEVKFKEALTYYKRYPTQKIGLILLDLDHFKPVNDTYGHAVGDELLQKVAEILLANVREVDVVGRLGGDEFVILAKGVNTEYDMIVIAKKLVLQISQPQQLDEYCIQIGASIGISICSENNSDMEVLFKQADEALYAAKDAGRSTYCIFPQE